MRRLRIQLSVLVVVLVIGSASLAMAGDKASHTASTELQWMETPFGPFVSPVAGDMMSGEHITYFRFGAGMKTPLHTHAASYVGIVISGTARHWIPGKPETKKDLGPGSHWSMPAGEEHVSECLPGVECVMVVFQKGAFDLIVQETGKK